MSTELLRVSMNEAQIEQACAEWARMRSSYNDSAATVKVEIKLVDTGGVKASVVFTKRRVRKAKGAPNERPA